MFKFYAFVCHTTLMSSEGRQGRDWGKCGKSDGKKGEKREIKAKLH